MAVPRTELNGKITRLLEPKSIAICGASDRSRWSSTIYRNLREGGFNGPISLVNSRGGTVHGQPAVVSCADLDGPVDLGIVMVPREAVLVTCSELADAGAGAAMILTSGFAETGQDGEALQTALTELARARRLTLLGPNSLGFINRAARVSAWATPMKCSNQSNGVAVVSQSGATALFLGQFAEEQNIGLSHVIATGNEADVGSAAFIDYLLDQVNVKSIAFFCETVRDPEGFIVCARKALRLSKPIVILKVGRSEITAASAASHTGALVGDDKVFDGICRQYGIIRVDSIEDLIVTADLAAFTGVLPRGGLALLSNSGGICEIAADKAHTHGIDLPALSEATIAELSRMLPTYGTPLNPLDLTGGVDPAQAETIVTLLGQQDDVAVVLCPYYRVPNGPDEMSQRLTDLHQGIAAGLNGAAVPGLMVSYATTHMTNFARNLSASLGIPYRACGLDRAMVALAGVMAWSERHRRDVLVPDLVSSPATCSQERPRSEYEVLRWLEERGVPVVPLTLATSEREAIEAAEHLGSIVAVKVASPDIAHKSDIGGVILNVPNAAAAGAAFRAVTRAARLSYPHAQIDGALVGPMRRGGVEMFVGIRRDPQWGFVLALGLGGIFVEVFEDVALRVLPVDAEEVRAMISQLRGFRMLDGARGATPVDLDALAATVVAISRAALTAGPDLTTLEINPLRVDGATMEALDGLIEWADTSGAHPESHRGAVR